MADVTPEWQKTLDAGVASAAAVPPWADAVPIVGPLIRPVAGVVGGLLREPSPEPEPALVSGPPAQAAPMAQAPMPSPMPRPGPGGANLGALDAQGNKIAAAGAAGLRDAQQAGEAIERTGMVRKQAAQEMAGAQQQRAQATAAGFDDQIAAQMAYQQRLDTVKKGEDEAVGAAMKSHEEAVQDAKYAGISGDRRRELQAVASNPNATPVQQASAKAELDKASNIDPDQYLGTAGRRITAAFAQALGALGSSLGGGPNFAMEIVQQAIKENIAAQRFGFQKKEREAENAGAAVDKRKKKFAEDRQDALRDYGIGLEMAKMKLGKITAGLEGTEAGARAKDLAAQLEAETLKNNLEIEQRARGQYQQALVQQGGLMTDKARLQEQRAEREADIVDPNAMAANLAARGLSMKDGVQLSKEEVKKVSEIKGAGDEALKGIQRLKELRAQAMANPSLLGSPEFSNKSQAAFRAAQVAYKKGAALGTWDEGSKQLLGDIFGKDPSGIGFLQSRYDEIERSARDSMTSQLGAFGVSTLESQQPGVPGEEPVGR